MEKKSGGVGEIEDAGEIETRIRSINTPVVGK
jgi:hypothetical protein